MKIVLSLNKKERLYDYISMGISTFVLGGEHSFYAPCYFTLEEIKELVNQYHDCHFYVAVNALYDNYKMKDVEDYLAKLDELGVYGIIFQDFGVLQICKENQYKFDVMYSPETLNTNVKTLNVLKKYGITSAFVSRVIPLEEQMMILKDADLPIMIQAHGVEYIAASKRELLSNYKQASGLEFDVSMESQLTIKARNSEEEYYIYEDDKGTHIFSKNRLYTIDLFNHLCEFDYLYIETLMMKEEEAIEIASLYSDALSSHKNGSYNKEVKEYTNLLLKLRTPLQRGFLFDSTVYKLEDMRKRDNERNQ